MKLSQMLGMRYKETPAECQTANHIFSIRGGYIKQVSSGVFSLYPPMRRITHKIENIIRAEMDAIGGQEVLFPVVMPASLWRESGRYDQVGSELLRLTDRSGTQHVLGMTHEEASVHLVRDIARSYQQYPFMIYQIQTKFRDEPRCRGGLIRVREFTMKDAYSFHTGQADLQHYYQRCLEAYQRIFARTGIPEVVAVESDSGMMGGNVSHEFMFLSEIGEDQIATCTQCDYRANLEAAACLVRPAASTQLPLTQIATPGIKTIDALCAFLEASPMQLAKAVVYRKNTDDTYVVVFIRGDLEVNETKLRNQLGCEIRPATEITADSGLTPGYIGPVALDAACTVVYDQSLQNAEGLYCGANEAGYHCRGLSMSRDVPGAVFTDVAKAVTGGICPQCGAESLVIANGVELGNIFQLGTKYSKSMGLQYLDSNGVLQYPIMGCYGVGVGRLAAAICEARHDARGPVWPMSVAPWQVQICALNADSGTVREQADALYAQLTAAGVETLYDDRSVSAGFMLAEADLLGCPLRIVVSPKTSARGAVELAARDKSFQTDIPVSENDYAAVITAVKSRIAEQLAALNA